MPDSVTDIISVTPSTIADETQQVVSESFSMFGLPASMLQLLTERGINIPTDVQIETIPLVARRQNLIVQAKTGTGKTFAFGLPLLALLGEPSGSYPRALVVAPTRELALQVHRDLAEFGQLLGLRTVAVYGGADASQQISSLKRGADIVVGTPGRLLDLASQQALFLDEIQHVVLDEADEMLNMGFLPDITKLLALSSNRSQTLLFSATMPTEIRQLARRFAINPYFIQVADGNTDGASVALVTQHVFKTHPLDKPEVLARLLQADGLGQSIVFCRTKRWAQRLSDEMNERGFNTAALHGDLSQVLRERALGRFKDGSTDVLIATDVAARGIDIDGITHVVNYDAPEDAATYLHRIGRTARAGRSGIAVTFVDLEFLPRWVFIARELGLSETPTETFSTSPHLYSDLMIPEGTKGRSRSAVPTAHHKQRDNATDRSITSRTARNGGNRNDSVTKPNAQKESDRNNHLSVKRKRSRRRAHSDIRVQEAETQQQTLGETGPETVHRAQTKNSNANEPGVNKAVTYRVLDGESTQDRSSTRRVRHLRKGTNE
jgi:superfamily II DNA/RNA helicase